MADGLTLQERRERWAAAREAFVGLDGELWRGGSAELEAVMGEIDGLVVAGEAGRVVVAAEAMSRGETGSGALALTPVQWVRRHAPSLKSGGAAPVVAVAEAFAVAGNAPVKDAVLSGVLPTRSAAVVVSEAEKLRPLRVDDAEPAVLEGLIEMAVREGPRVSDDGFGGAAPPAGRRGGSRGLRADPRRGGAGRARGGPRPLVCAAADRR